MVCPFYTSFSTTTLRNFVYYSAKREAIYSPLWRNAVAVEGNSHIKTSYVGVTVDIIMRMVKRSVVVRKGKRELHSIKQRVSDTTVQ